MIIVVEGPDNAGKSTFCELLQNELAYFGREARVKHTEQPKTTDPWDEYDVALGGATGYGATIFDRLHWGEMVYPKLYRPETADRYTRGHFFANELKLTTFGGVVVLLTHDEDVLIERCRKNDEDFLREEDVATCKQYFDTLFESCVAPAVRLTDPDTNDAITVILRGLVAEADENRRGKGYGYAGYSNPEIMFVAPDRLFAPGTIRVDDPAGLVIACALYDMFLEHPRAFGVCTSSYFDTMIWQGPHHVLEEPETEQPHEYSKRTGLENTWLDT